jgi:photoactive yellow protein
MSAQLSVPSSKTPQSIDLSRLSTMSGEELDVLPFGVIGLDRGGTIRRYNLAEARFARLDRTQVLGQSFFERVAPCTATPEFQGRFVDFVREGNRVPSVKFPYVFDFRFGAQEVEVELVRGRGGDEFYVCINRRKFLPRRSNVPSMKLGAAQQDLAPHESKLGVMRDDAQRRIVHLSPIFFESLRAAWDSGSPEWATFGETWGIAWGRRAVVDLETEVLEAFDRLMRELPMVTVVEVIASHLRKHGWGQLVVDFAPSRRGVFLLQLQRNAYAESLGAAKVPQCHLFCGFFTAVFSHLANKRLVAREVRCITQGHAHCELVVGSAERTVAIDAAIASAGGDVARMVALLEGGVR